MPKLVSSRDVDRVLRKLRFNFVGQKGSHQKYGKDGRVVIVPANRREIPVGTFKSILRQADISEEYFRGLL